MKTGTALPLFALAAGLAAAPAAAQDRSGGWTVTIGAGAQTFPRYPGDDVYSIHPMPIFGLRRAGTPMPLIAPDDGFGFGLLGRDSVINFGPSVGLQSARQESDVGAPVGNVPFTIEAGGFVELFPVRSFRLRGQLRQGIGGHKGLVGSLGADLVLRDADTYIFSVGPRARWADRAYQQAYFGVTPAVAARTGLAPFAPDGGFYAYGAMAGLTYKLGRNWGARGYVGYDRLVRNAADSPIVRAYGSRDQFSGGAGLFLEFNVGR
jgi:outer membrane protein